MSMQHVASQMRNHDVRRYPRPSADKVDMGLQLLEFLGGWVASNTLH